MMAERPLSVLIGALGGQGGGILTDWLVEAARLAGYPAQATSIPGVAQRTGATTYYIELFPERQPVADPVFCLYPSAGDVDLVAALEPTEAGRALAAGYITGHTAVITSAARIYSTTEKSVAGDGIVPLQPLWERLEQAAGRLIRLHPATDAPLNAQMFGALIGSGILPIPLSTARAAIEARGLAVAENMAAFAVGLQALQPDNGPVNGQSTSATAVYEPPPPLFHQAIAAYPETLRPLVGHALARLVDYQNVAYARSYLARLEQVLAADRQAGGAARGFCLTAAVARPLAAWMSYEDAPRVAQLKTRPGRLARIRAEMAAAPDEPVTVTDYLTPGRDQLANLLPARFAVRFLVSGNRDNGARVHGVPVAWPTSTAVGYVLLKLLAGLRRLRPYSHTFAGEQALIDSWLEAVIQATAVEYDLACQVAQVAIWSRGYGAIRARGQQRLQTLFTHWVARLHSQPDVVKADVAALLVAARNNPDSPG